MTKKGEVKYKRYFRRKKINPSNKNKSNDAKIVQKPRKEITKKINRFIEITKKLKQIGPGKRGKVYFQIPKENLRVSVGQIILEEDGLYKVDSIRKGCSATTIATIYCSPFDPSTMKESKILVPKS